MRHFKRVICLLVVICIFGGIIPVPAIASESYDTVPLFYQTDYPNTPYRDGSIATSGCSIVCLSMVASYLTDTTYSPASVVELFRHYDGSNMDRMEQVSSDLGLPNYEKIYDWSLVPDALVNGGVVIALMNSASAFTDSQHFIVLTGMTDGGKILVNDPYEPNYSNPDLQEGFRNGFSISDISNGFDGAWAYYKPVKEAPAEPVVTEPIPTVTEPVFVPDELKALSDIPLYFQTDYPDAMYGSDYLVNTGSGITCLAMVASYLTGQTYAPDDLAARFGDATGSLMERMEHASKSMDIPAYKKIYDWDGVLSALDSNKVVIALMNSASVFTDSQHFVVLTGITEGGRILINDPYAPNYLVSDLQFEYKNGFVQEGIIAGFEGAWAYEKAPEPEAEDTSTIKNNVPLFYQTDYPNTRYGTGTIATCGCSMTSLAMVASYLTGHTYSPPELVEFFEEFNGNHLQRLEYGSNLLQLPWTKADNFNTAIQALREGKVVIALMNEKSIFTTGQHFIVFTGITEEGKVLVHDPNENNYGLWNLKNGFANGFEEWEVLRGYSGGWIYDKCAMPENPFIYSMPEEEPTQSRYPDISLTASETDLLASIIWLEARGESFEGQQAIAEVILNRMVSEGFSNSLKGVIFAEGQFPSTAFLDTAEPIAMQYDAIERALNGPNVLPMDVVFYATYSINDHIWGKLGGHIFCYK